MAKTTSSRRGRTVKGADEKSEQSRGTSPFSVEACVKAIRETGWSPEWDTTLLEASRSGIDPQVMDELVREARRLNNGNLWRLLAQIAAQAGADSDAKAHATEALQLQPDDVPTMIQLGQLAEKRRDKVATVQWYRRILDIDENEVNTNRALARLHYEEKEYELACQFLTRLQELEPKVRINKLYWLLAKVKSGGIHGLAQALTEVRRWRTLNEEELPLAHELFAVVGEQCLQAGQRARAKQYLARAQQLVSTAKVEALLAEMPDQASAATSTPKATATTKTLPLYVPDVYVSPPTNRSLEKLGGVLLSDTRRLQSRVYDFFTSWVGITSTLATVALLVILAMPDSQEPLGLHDASARASAIADNRKDIPSRPAPKLLPESQTLSRAVQAASDAGSTTKPLATTATTNLALEQKQNKTIPPKAGPENRNAALSTAKPQDSPRRSVPTSASVANPEPKASPPPVVKPVAPTPPAMPAATTGGSKQRGNDTAVKNEVRTDKPPPVADMPQKTVAPASSPQASTVTAPATKSRPEVSSSLSVIPTGVIDNRASAASQRTATISTPSSPVPNSEAPNAVTAATAPLSLPDASRVGEPLPPSTQMEKRDLPVPVRHQPGASGNADTESLDPAALQKPESKTSDVTRTITATTPASETTAPISELKEPSTADVLSLAPATPVQASPSSVPGRRSDDAIPTPEGQDQTETGIPVERQTPISSTESGDPQITANIAADVNRTSRDRDAVKTPLASTVGASPVIARLTSELPHSAQFPTRERVVSVPPDQALDRMTNLMKQETGDSAVGKRGERVLRAKVSGKRPKVSKGGTRTYGQYFVEVLPGPKEGTSRVRAKVMMFDWRTGLPVGDANALADRFLKKVPE